jgi:hypothetical protein
MTAHSMTYPSSTEFVVRVIAFGVLVIAAVAAIVLAGAWWAASIAVAGKLLAAAGLVVSVLALMSDEQAASWRASRRTAVTLGALSAAATVAALVAA